MLKYRDSSGFTLVEIAIVLLIVTILLGYSVAMLTVQQELKQYRQAQKEITDIVSAVEAFAQVNGYLPCPAWADDLAAPTVSSNGFECREDGGALDCGGSDPTVDSCDVWFGFVPGKTLGLEGRYSPNTGLLLDPWGMPYRYQVSDSNTGSNPPLTDEDDFVMVGEMKDEGIPNLVPDLVVCSADPSPGTAGPNDVRCASSQEVIIGAGGTTNCSDPGVSCAPVVVFSTGKDKLGNVAANSWVQRENLDNTINDRVFVSTTISTSGGSEFDDVVQWISPNVLYSKMIEAGQLP